MWPVIDQNITIQCKLQHRNVLHFNIFIVGSCILVVFFSFISGWPGLQILDGPLDVKMEVGIILQEAAPSQLERAGVLLGTRTCSMRLDAATMGTGPCRAKRKSLKSFQWNINMDLA